MKPNIRHKVQAAIADFLADPHQWDMSLAGTGPIYRLEQKFTSLTEQPYALAVSNATMGLWSIFLSLEITDAEIITTPYTWGGSLTGIILNRNRPVFADIDVNTLTLDPEKVLSCITSKTKAILAVDIYGHPCQGQVLRGIADEHGLLLIQDCSQSFGACCDERHTGWWADVAVFSLSWGKVLFAGEGGMVVMRNQEIYERLVWKTQHPLRQRRDVPHLPNNEMAANLRLSPLSAICAETAFDDALSSVEARRDECLSVLDLLHKEKLIRLNMPELNKVKPAFHALTVTPLCEEKSLRKRLQVNGLKYKISSPSVVEPFYCHHVYRRLANSHQWPRHYRCPVAEKECSSRLRLKRFDVGEREIRLGNTE